MHKRNRPGILFMICSLFVSSCSTSTAYISTPTTRPPTVDIPAKTVQPTTTPLPVVPDEPADIIFHNGNIITVEQSQPLAEAVAIRGSLIQAVGSDTEVLAFAGADTIRVDLKRNTLMPGFINNHTHYLRNGLDAGISLNEMMTNFLRFGYTSETEMTSVDEFIATMLEAEKNGEVPIRVNIFAEYNCGFLENGKSIECISWYKDNPPILEPERMIRIPGVKIFMDGAGIPRRGCQYQSFDFPATVTEVWPDVFETCGTPRGDLYLTEAQLIPVLQDIQDRGYKAAFHAMGDASIEIILNAAEVVLAGESNSVYRHEIAHCSLLSPQLIDRFVQMDFLAQFGGMFNVSEADWYKAAFGEEHYTWAADRYALPGLGVHVSFGNDYNARGDIKNLNPFRGMWGYVTKKELLADGTIVDPPEWVAKYKLNVDRALELMTIEGAYSVFMEDHIGSILPGKFADLIIISADPMTMDPDEILGLNVIMTMVNGEVKYCAYGEHELCPQSGNSAAAIPVTGSETTIPSTPGLEDNYGAPGIGEIILSEDFETNSPAGWIYHPAEWTIITDELSGSQVWTSASDTLAYAATRFTNWTDYVFQIQARRIEGVLNIYFRAKGDASYGMRLGEKSIVLWTERSGSPVDLLTANVGVGSLWHTYEIQVIKNQIRISMDGKQVINYADGEQAFLSGGIALEIISGKGGGRFDNLRVSKYTGDQ